MSRLEQLEKMHAADPTDADVMYMIAQEHATAGNHKAAAEWFDRCLDADEGYLYAYYHKARSQQADNKLDDARATLRIALERARTSRDEKAVNEITEFLNELA